MVVFCLVFLFICVIALFAFVVRMEAVLADSVSSIKNEHQVDIEAVSARLGGHDSNILTLTSLYEENRSDIKHVQECNDELFANLSAHLDNHINMISNDVAALSNEEAFMVTIPDADIDLVKEAEIKPRTMVQTKWTADKKADCMSYMREHKSEFSFAELEKRLEVPKSTLKRWYKEIQ